LALGATCLAAVHPAGGQVVDSAGKDATPQHSIALVSLVITADSGVPVPGAEIVIPSTAHRVKTDRDGFFSLGGLYPGIHTVLVRAIGFRPVEITVELQPGVPFYRILDSIVLEQETVELEEIVVTGSAVRGMLAGCYQRRQHGLGTYFTREEIEDRDPIKTSDLIRHAGGGLVHCDAGLGNTPGFVDCVIGRRRGSRFCAFDVYLDGAPLFGTRGSIDFIDPREIEAIEVYGSVATTPLVFSRRTLQPNEALNRRGAAGTCGAVALWTRTPK
jgi:hypothetical protein